MFHDSQIIRGQVSTFNIRELIFDMRQGKELGLDFFLTVKCEDGNKPHHFWDVRGEGSTLFPVNAILNLET